MGTLIKLITGMLTSAQSRSGGGGATAATVGRSRLTRDGACGATLRNRTHSTRFYLRLAARLHERVNYVKLYQKLCSRRMCGMPFKIEIQFV